MNRLPLLLWSVIVLGLLLLGYMVLVEGEPGAVPLLLIVLGLGGLYLIHGRAR